MPGWQGCPGCEPGPGYLALSRLGVEELLICGMTTQNCLTHTAISKAAKKHSVKILPDCCTSVSEMIHLIALNALSTRVVLAESGAAL